MLIAAPNLTTDRVVRIDELRPGEVQRFSESRVLPGGKGVNVARVARSLGFPALLVALAPGLTGRAVVEMTRSEGLDIAPVETQGEVRAASVILERGGRVTVLNEPGPAVRVEEWERYASTVEEHLAGQRFLVCTGSTPPGAPVEGYGSLVRAARLRGIPALVDAAGESLAAALEAGPELVTPNVIEAEQMPRGAGPQPVEDVSVGIRSRALVAAASLVARGARGAVVTAGGAGAAVAEGPDRWWVGAPAVQVTNPIGAGDSLVGGLVGALERGETLKQAVRVGVAAAGASVESEIPDVDPERVWALARQLGS